MAAYGLGCSPGSEPVAAKEVLFAGCRTVDPGPRCGLYDHRRLTLWVANTGSPLEIRAGDGHWSTSDGLEIEGGKRLEIQIPEAAEVVVVGPGPAAFHLTIDNSPRTAWSREVLTAIRAGDLGTAKAIASDFADATDSYDRAWALGFLGRLLLQEAPQQGVDSLALALDAHAESGRSWPADDDRTVLVAVLLSLGQLDRAAKELATRPDDFLANTGVEIPTSAGLPTESLYLRAYYRGLLAEKLGDTRTALRELARAESFARKGGTAAERRSAAQIRARELIRIGRSEEGLTILQGLYREIGDVDSAAAPSPERAEIEANLAWASLLVHDAGKASAVDPRPLLQAALGRIQGPIDPGGNGRFRLSDDEVRVRLDLALASLQRAELDAARTALEPVSSELPTLSPRLRIWTHDLLARVAAAAGDLTSALIEYQRLHQAAVLVGAEDALWRSAIGRGRILQRQGKQNEALEAFAEAEDRLDQQILSIPLFEGRDSFLADRQQGVEGLVGVLLDTGRTAEALNAIRRARARGLRAAVASERLASLDPEARQRWATAVGRWNSLRDQLENSSDLDWQRSSSDLQIAKKDREVLRGDLTVELDTALAELGSPPRFEPATPRRGELVLAPVPVAGTWQLLVAEGTEVRTLPSPGLAAALVERDPIALAKALLEPIAESLRRSERLRWLPWGPLRSIDVHTLPFDHRPLVATLPVVWGLDLGRSESRSCSNQNRAVVVADPRSDLPAARREGRAVSTRLADRLAVLMIEQGEASREHLDALLPGAAIFHYAGHGVYEEDGRSFLPLAGETRFDLGDLLLLDCAPTQVVLSGCETARSSGTAPLETLGLAQAFIVAGSQGVIAATRSVDDEFAAAFFEKLWQDPTAATDLAAALARLQAVSTGNPDAVAAFRYYEP